MVLLSHIATVGRKLKSTKCSGIKFIKFHENNSARSKVIKRGQLHGYGDTRSPSFFISVSGIRQYGPL